MVMIDPSHAAMTLAGKVRHARFDVARATGAGQWL